MTNARDFIAGASGFGGTGSDGAFAPGDDYDFDDAEGSWVIKQYSSITINDGETISATNRIKGLILYCSGNVVIDGEIDLDGKGYGSEQAPPIVYDRYYSSGVLKSAWVEYCSSVRGGDGGGGGGRASTYADPSVYGGDGAHAGGSSTSHPSWPGVNASGWTPGYNGTQTPFISTGGGLLSIGISLGQMSIAGGQSGGAGYFGTINSGGTAGQGGTTYATDAVIVGKTYATLTTSPVSKYGGALLVIIAKGSITIGSTANIHCEGESSANLTSEEGCDGGSGGGCVVLLSESEEPDIDGSATISTDGGSGGDNASGKYGGDGGDGDAGTIVYDMVE